MKRFGLIVSLFRWMITRGRTEIAGLDVVLMNYLGYGRLNGVRFCFDEFNFGMIMR